MTTTLDQADLNQFIGSENWYRHGLNRKIFYTDGVKYLAEQAGAYWLLDAIVLTQLVNRAVARQAFQAWKLIKRPDQMGRAGEDAVLICEDGNHNEVYRQSIAFTDFPLPEITLWLTDNTLLLPSEY